MIKRMGVKVLTVIGTRPEAIKLFPLIHALEADLRFESRVCVTGQHRELVNQVLNIAAVIPNHDLGLMQPDQGLDTLTARLLIAVSAVVDSETPDWVIVQGDTTTAMSAALAAHYRRIPICHVEAGLRSGDMHNPWPEEANRRIIATIAALHCAPTLTSARALEQENVDPATVHVTGNTAIDALLWITGRLRESPNLAAGLVGAEARFAGRRIIGVTSHRRENFGTGMRAIAAAIRRLAAREDVALVFPLHPNPNVGEIMVAELGGLENVMLLPPLDYPHFAYLMGISHLLLTDSGGVQEEAPALGKPVLVMRRTTERPEGVEAGTAKLVGTDPDRIVAEAVILLDDAKAYEAMARVHHPFGDGKASERIVEILAKTGVH